MAQSLVNILLLVVLSTKNRAPYLDPSAVREGMSGDLVGTLRNIGCPSLATHCVADHVPMLCQLSRTLTVAKLVEEIKTSSSKLMIGTQVDVCASEFNEPQGASPG